MPSLVRHRTRNNVSSWGGGRCSLVGCLSRSYVCGHTTRTAAGVSVPEEHLMFRHELRALSVVESKGFDWDTYLVHLCAPGSFKRRNTSPLDFCMSCLSLEDDDQDIRILVDDPRALAAAVRVLETVPVSHLRAYLRWHAVLSLTPYLPARFTATHHDFFRIRVTGRRRQRSRRHHVGGLSWRRCTTRTVKLWELFTSTILCRHFRRCHRVFH